MNGRLTAADVLAACGGFGEVPPRGESCNAVPASTPVDELLSRGGHGWKVVGPRGECLGFIHLEGLARALLSWAKEMEQELSVIINATDNGIMAIDRNRQIVLFNAAAARITGIPIDRAMGADVRELIPGTRLPEVLESGESEIGQKLILGGSMVVSNRTPVYKDGQRVGAVAVFQDVTGLQKVLSELGDVRNLADTLDAILEHAYEGVVVVDENGIITMFNRAYEEFLGVEREQVIGRHVTECIENTRMHIVVQTGIPEIGERQKIKNQEMVVSRIPIKKNGRIVGAVGKVLFRDLEELKAMAERLNVAEKRVQYYERELRRLAGASKYTFADMLGHSEAISRLKSLASRVARGISTVLIRGESGTGKELLAHAIHSASPRAEGPFVRVNCAAIPRDLLESELFGYEKGAFTGATSTRAGKFELANGGTIFLDEIGDMPLEMQAKVLRVLQEREFQRVGGQGMVAVDIRVLAATNKDLERMVGEGKFREDLYYRLNVVTLTIPPLREHPDDIPDLVRHFMTEVCGELRVPVKRVSPEAMLILQRYHWPGNVRQLHNVIEFLANTVYEAAIMPHHLPLTVRIHGSAAQTASDGMLSALVEDIEREAIRSALRATRGNKRQAARRLGIGRSTLYAKMVKYGIA